MVFLQSQSLMGWLKSYGLAAVPLLALAAGLPLLAAGQANLAEWFFAAGIAPVLAVLVVTVFRSLSKGEFGLDIIAALAMGGALIGGEELAGVVVALMFAGGQALEQFAQGRAQRDMTALLERVPRSAQVYRDGHLEEVPILAILPGERLLIRAGEVIPVDGILRSEAATLDESALTGEPLPVTRVAGGEVASGVANAGRPFDLQAIRTAANSTYAGVIRLVEQARLSKAPMARLADRYALAFLAITVVLAGGAWWLTGDAKRALAVLVVATPCPLILAVPVAIVAGMSRCASRGVLVKSARILELLPQIRSVVLDKTGTLTDGFAKAVRIEPAEGFDEARLLGLAASVGQASQHVISRSLVDTARKSGLVLSPPAEVHEVPGDGVRAMIGLYGVAIGHPDFIARTLHSNALTLGGEEMLAPGTITLAVSVDGRFAGRIFFADSIRADAAATLSSLRRSGARKITLLTGDQDAVARHVGEIVGVDQVVANATPEQKVFVVHHEAMLQPTMMVGDGINDAPALAAADIGVAMGARGAAAASEAADIVVLVDEVGRLAEAVGIARRTRALALQSVFAGMGLSTLGMIAAAFGYLTPVAGALVQEAIDVAVILNALRALTSGVSKDESWRS
jgi:heavy metal translocating P-type ATPase